MIDFSNVNQILIPEGDVSKIEIAGREIWKKKKSEQSPFVTYASWFGFYYSYDGVNWEKANADISTSTLNYYGGLFYGDGLYVWKLRNYTYYSTDGINWEKKNDGQYSFERTYYNQKKETFIGGELHISPTVASFLGKATKDSILNPDKKWEEFTINPPSTTPKYLTSIFEVEDNLFASLICSGTRKNGLYCLIDNVWTMVTTIDKEYVIYDVLSINGEFYGLAVVTNTSNKSTNIYKFIGPTYNDWELFSNVTNEESCCKFIYGGGKFVALGGDSFYYSTDGINWEKSPSEIKYSGYDRYIAYKNNRFVTAGKDWGSLYYSTDGINWVKVESNVVSDNGCCGIA